METHTLADSIAPCGKAPKQFRFLGKEPPWRFVWEVMATTGELGLYGGEHIFDVGLGEHVFNNDAAIAE